MTFQFPKGFDQSMDFLIDVNSFFAFSALLYQPGTGILPEPSAFIIHKLPPSLVGLKYVILSPPGDQLGYLPPS